MTIQRIEQKVLLTPDMIMPSHPSLKVVGVFNPAAVRFGDKIYMLARIAEGAAEEREGFKSSPRITAWRNGEPEYTIDWLRIGGENDPRAGSDGAGFSRLSFISHLRLVILDESGFSVEYIDERPTFFPSERYEEFGVEDPRITCIDGVYYITYVAVSTEANVCTALASTTDFKTFRRLGIIFPAENKDVVILPGKFARGYCAFHRPVAKMQFSPPSMHVAYSPDLLHWGQHGMLFANRPGFWDEIRIGGGTVPLRVREGWLEIYHGVRKAHAADQVGMYCAGATLFDGDNPHRLIARSADPILEPEAEWEKKGFVSNVVFPTAKVLDRDGAHLTIFCGAADLVVEAVRLPLPSVMDALRPVTERTSAVL